MYIIKMHHGFMIAEWLEQFKRCRLTKNMPEALKFESRLAAQEFLNKYDGFGINKNNAKIIDFN